MTNYEAIRAHNERIRRHNKAVGILQKVLHLAGAILFIAVFVGYIGIAGSIELDRITFGDALPMLAGLIPKAALGVLFVSM